MLEAMIVPLATARICRAIAVHSNVVSMFLFGGNVEGATAGGRFRLGGLHNLSGDLHVREDTEGTNRFNRGHEAHEAHKASNYSAPFLQTPDGFPFLLFVVLRALR